jgi:hypothetical protein
LKIIVKFIKILLFAALLVGFDTSMKGGQAGDIIAVEPDGSVTFSPSFPMSHHDNSSEGLPITSLTYSADNVQNTNGAAAVTFVGTTVFWFAQNPALVTNSIATIRDLKQLIDTNSGVKPAWATNLVEKIVKFQGQEALEFSGNFSGLWHDQIIMLWLKTKDRRRNSVFAIDAQAQKKEVCKTLVEAVTIHPPKAD